MTRDRKLLILIGLWVIGGIALGHYVGEVVFRVGGEGATVLVGLLYSVLLPASAKLFAER